jgi:hypothetical protein
MQIDKNLPQFVNEHALIVVAAKQSAELYAAHNGEIEQLDTFTIERPKPDDVEGHFEQSGHGKTIRAGSSYDPNKYDEKAQSQFLHELGTHLDAVTHEHARDAVYLFVPEHLKNSVQEALPKDIASQIQHIYSGNLTKQHAFELLKRIGVTHSEADMTQMGPHEEEAQEILRKTEEQ